MASGYDRALSGKLTSSQCYVDSKLTIHSLQVSEQHKQSFHRILTRSLVPMDMSFKSNTPSKQSREVQNTADGSGSKLKPLQEHVQLE
jgi:hypothetical protein